MAGWSASVTAPNDRPTVSKAARHGVISRDGARWIVALGAYRVLVPDLVGLGYLAELLTRPGREIPALMLASRGSAPREQTRDAVLDDVARTAYAARARELSVELTEAEAHNDIARVDHLRVELDALVDQLETTTGLGGRHRAFTDSTERARTAVRKAIKRALDVIDDANPVIGDLLRRTISTGVTCVYRPEAHLPVVWTTGHPPPDGPGGPGGQATPPRGVEDDPVTGLTIGDWLHRESGRHFVGRAAELDLVRSALDAPSPPFSVLYVHGPGGVGKTALLDRVASSAGSAGRLPVRLDLHTIEPTVSAFLEAFATSLGWPDGDATPHVLAECGHLVVLIDTFELGEQLQDWLWHEFVADLPLATLVVFAGRNPPPPRWLADPGWRALSRVVALENLSAKETGRYLELRGVEAGLHTRLWALTRGHPLALSLVVDLLGQRTEREQDVTDLMDTPDVVRTLMHRFVGEIPDQRHREALAVCAHARYTTEDLLLRAATGVDDAGELFEWLRSRPFVEEGRYGLFPHDLAREVLDTDLRWRDRVAYEDLHDRVRAHIVGRVRHAIGLAQQRAAADLMYLHRLNPVMGPLFDWAQLDHVYCDRLTDADREPVLAMTERHQGRHQAALVRHWLDLQPDAFVVFRREPQDVQGFAALLRLHLASADEIAADPGASALWRYATQHGSLRPGESVVATRFMVDRDRNQDRPSLGWTGLSIAHIVTLVEEPGLALGFFGAFQTPEVDAYCKYVDHHRVPEAEFVVGGRRHVVYAHDWRRLGVDAFMERMHRRELDGGAGLALSPGVVPAHQVAVLSRSEFAAAVRRALRDRHRPQQLGANPLARSRLVQEAQVTTTDGSGPVQVLVTLLDHAINALAADPRDSKLHRAVERTFLHPTTTQEQAAEVLGLPFSTYRRHLRQGIDRVVDELWDLEVYGDRVASTGSSESCGHAEPGSR